ncbi:hypothetical protein CERSUDRAFT_55726 [Gelatoporia subvermispora B]|uniref:Uncharacterized protein n=1 Tax=Ceriporiopsis subvermispora (strain B) TaxID=914234 RepID=M2R4Y0_CERS8|nr:hypothetical protein CERSUDRAFT_55726 [Gelatoporia subvermispora B]
MSPTNTHFDDRSDVDETTLRSRSNSRAQPRHKSIDEKDQTGWKTGETLPVSDGSTDDNTDPTPFAFKPSHLSCLVDPKDLERLRDMGGIDAVLRGLGTDGERGLARLGETVEVVVPESTGEGVAPGIVVTEPVEDGTGQQETAYRATFAQRRAIYDRNVLPPRIRQGFLGLMWRAMKDKVLILLTIATSVSLALGLVRDLTSVPPRQPAVDWVEGVAIMVAMIIAVMIGSLNDWLNERRLQVVDDLMGKRGVRVIRNGVEQFIDIEDVMVGDVTLLEPGEIIPCDGILISGYNIKCDESGVTGESDIASKLSYRDCIRSKGAGAGDGTRDDVDSTKHADCFLVSGSKVLEGCGRYVVIAVGPHSFNGRIMLALRSKTEATQLQANLDNLAGSTAKLGSTAGLVLFASLMIRYFVQLGTGSPARTSLEKAVTFIQILIISIILIMVAVPEGLPLVFTHTSSLIIKHMAKEGLLVRNLGSCETLDKMSVICTDKTGLLTKNNLTVIAGSIGIHCKFVRDLGSTNLGQSGGPNGVPVRTHVRDFSVDQCALNTVMSPKLQDLLNQAIAINSTAFEQTHPETGKISFAGSKTDIALLKFAQGNRWPSHEKTREEAHIVDMVPLSSSRASMGTLVRMPGGCFRLYLKGPSDVLAKSCKTHIVVRSDAVQRSIDDDVETTEIDEPARDNILRTNITYSEQGLRTIALCYRDFDSWPLPIGRALGDDVVYDDLAKDMILIGIIGIEETPGSNVSEAIENCFRAGVAVKLCTGDNVLTARTIATQCGIFTSGGIIMEGKVFRSLEKSQMLRIAPHLQVLAGSSPGDKQLLIKTLQSLGEVVGVAGDCAPALTTADVGFGMGLSGTETARDASDVILMDDNFAPIVNAIAWGRRMNDAIRKFLQFQIPIIITVIVTIPISAIASAQESSAFSAVQLIWISTIMDTFAAIALTTDLARPLSLDRRPDRSTTHLLTVDIYKQIIGQSIYQIVTILIFHFLGSRILALEHSSHSDTVIRTFVFNTFVFTQISNSFNCRRVDNRLNIFESILHNYYFMGITLIETLVQVLIISVGGSAFQVTRVSGREWGLSLALGVVSIPLGALIRLMPNEPVKRFLIKVRLLQSPDVLPITVPEAEWNAVIGRARDNLSTFRRVRGAHMRAEPSYARSNHALPWQGPRVRCSSLMTMVPTVTAVSTSVERRLRSSNGISDPTRFHPSKSSVALWEGKVQVHPDTASDDAVFLIGDPVPCCPEPLDLPPPIADAGADMSWQHPAWNSKEETLGHAPSGTGSPPHSAHENDSLPEHSSPPSSVKED